MRTKRCISICVFTSFTIFVILNINYAKTEFDFNSEDPDFPKSLPKLSQAKRRPTTKRLTLVEKSVLIRYGDTDDLRILNAYIYKEEITVVLKSYGYMSRRVFCRYFDNSSNELLPSNQSIVFPNFLVHCPSRAEAVKIAISIDSKENIDGTLIKLLKKRDDGPRYFFSVCLAPLFGPSPKWLHIIEFIEYYKMQGAEHFYVYVKDVTDVERKILDSYADLLDIIELDKETACLNKHRCRHEVQLQDCVYRAREHSKWVATIDLDERLTVADDSTIAEFLSDYGSESLAEFRFRCRWILRYKEIPENYSPTWSSELPILKWSNTSHVAPVNHTSKSIISPANVESMGVHQVLRVHNNAVVQLVEPDDGVVRHYRLQEGWSRFLTEVEEFGKFEDTAIPQKISKPLLENITTKIMELVKMKVLH